MCAWNCNVSCDHTATAATRARQSRRGRLWRASKRTPARTASTGVSRDHTAPTTTGAQQSQRGLARPCLEKNKNHTLIVGGGWSNLRRKPAPVCWLRQQKKESHAQDLENYKNDTLKICFKGCTSLPPSLHSGGNKSGTPLCEYFYTWDRSPMDGLRGFVAWVWAVFVWRRNQLSSKRLQNSRRVCRFSRPALREFDGEPVARPRVQKNQYSTCLPWQVHGPYTQWCMHRRIIIAHRSPSPEAFSASVPNVREHSCASDGSRKMSPKCKQESTVRRKSYCGLSQSANRSAALSTVR